MDVSLDKSVSNLRPNQNDVVTYTIVTSNVAGRDTAHNVFYPGYNSNWTH
ncbi:MAG: hypothetical protein IPL23_30655 [Saprospiraceae bacterium]|nr:hypothetical protein [Saprospiraceae bacterium]